MFFNPLNIYLRTLLITLIVEVVLFFFLISKKPLKITAAALFNILSHLLLHIFFHYAIVYGLNSRLIIWLIGEISVVTLEAFLFHFGRVISPVKRAFFYSILFNVSSIIIGYLMGLIL